MPLFEGEKESYLRPSEGWPLEDFLRTQQNMELHDLRQADPLTQSKVISEYLSRGGGEHQVRNFFGVTRTTTTAGSGLNLDEGETDVEKIIKALTRGSGVSGPSAESLRGQLKQQGFMLPFDVMPLVRGVAGKPYAWETLISRITADPRFRKAYPGLLDKQGNIKMSPHEYNERKNQYRALAAQYGFQLSDGQFGSMMDGDVSANEANERLKAAQVIYRNQDVYINFKAELDYINAARRAKGQAPIQGLNSVKDVASFVMKTAPKELFQVYEAASLRTAAAESGVSISTQRARDIAAQSAGIYGLDEAEKGFRQVAESLRAAGAELSAFGITQADLETIEFGGRNRNALASRAQQALKQAEAQAQVEIAGEGATLQKGRPVVEEQGGASF